MSGGEGGGGSWSVGPTEAREIHVLLTDFLADTAARTAMLLDRSGRLVACEGDKPGFDLTTFASLAAADYGANDQLARLLGEAEFNGLVHQGERDAMHLADVGRQLVLVTLFDVRTTLGLVRWRARAVVQALAAMLPRLQAAVDAAVTGVSPDFASQAEAEIDKLFGG